MAIPFSIPNSQGYLPAPTHDYLSQPSLGDQPLDSTPANPIQAQLIAKILEAVNAQPPTAPPHKKRGKLANFILGGTPMYEEEKKREYEQSPEHAQYEQQLLAYNNRDVGALSSLAGSLGRNDLSVIREQRLQQAQKFRQDLLSQFKPDTRQEYDYTTNTNRYHTYYRDPLRNNQVVYDEWTDYLPIHSGQYAGPGGEPVYYTTSPSGQMPSGPPQPSSSIAAPGGTSAGAPGVTLVPRPTEGGIQPGAGQPSNMISNPMPRRGQESQLVRPSTAHQAPAAVAGKFASQTAFTDLMGQLMDVQRPAHAQQIRSSGPINPGQGVLGLPGHPINYAEQVIKDFAAGNKYGQPLLQGGPNQALIDYKSKMLPLLYMYTKSQTGVQFSYLEFLRYESLFPTTLDDERTAQTKIGNLVEVIRSEMGQTQRQFGGLVPPGGAQPKSSTLRMPASKFEQLRATNPQGAQNFIDDGGEVY